MEKFKIFIASSIDDLKEERSALANFATDLNRELRHNYEIEIDTFRCEPFDHRYSAKRMQDVFNQELLESDLAIFMFFHDAGKGTLEEYQIAKSGFHANESPVIYVYFKSLEPGDKPTEALVRFRHDLYEQDGHYPENFSHIDTIKLRITLCVQSLLKGFPQVNTENGYLMLDNTKLMSLENVAEFSNNKILRELQTELAEIETTYLQIKLSVESGKSPVLEEEYRRLKLKKEKILATITELRKNIFEMSMNMCNDTLRGKISTRQREAYRVFEAGDYEGCLAILSEDDLDNDFLATQAQLEELARQNATKYIKEHTMAIKVLQLMINDPTRYEKIDRRFQKVIPVARKHGVETFVIYYYAVFLYTQRRFRDALSVSETLRKRFLEGEEKISPLQQGKLNNFLGTLHFMKKDYEQARKFYLETKKIGMMLEAESEHVTGSGLGRVNNNLAVMAILSGSPENAEPLFLDAKKRFEHMTEIDYSKYLADVAGIKKNLGYLYAVTGRGDEAKDILDEALETYNECLSLDDKFQITAKLGELHCAMSARYQLEGDYREAEKHLLKALKKVTDLSVVFPAYYDYDFAVIYSGLGSVCRHENRHHEATAYFEKAIGIMAVLEADCPDIYAEEVEYLNALSAENKENLPHWALSPLMQKHGLGFYV